MLCACHFVVIFFGFFACSDTTQKILNKNKKNKKRQVGNENIYDSCVVVVVLQLTEKVEVIEKEREREREMGNFSANQYLACFL